MNRWLGHSLSPYTLYTDEPPTPLWLLLFSKRGSGCCGSLWSPPRSSCPSIHLRQTAIASTKATSGEQQDIEAGVVGMTRSLDVDSCMAIDRCGWFVSCDRFLVHGNSHPLGPRMIWFSPVWNRIGSSFLAVGRYHGVETLPYPGPAPIMQLFRKWLRPYRCFFLATTS